MIKALQDPADRLVRGTTILAVTLALLVLAGWLFDVAALRTVAPLASAMAPLTPILIILLSAAMVWLEKRRSWANLAMLACALLATAVLVEVLFGVRLGMTAVTRILDRRAGSASPELPDAETASAMLMLVGALLCWRTRYTRLHDFADVMVVVIGLVCLQVLLAYTYNVVTTEAAGGFRQVATHTTLTIMVLAFAATARRPSLGLYGAMRGSAHSALQLRRLLPATILFCAVIGWLHIVAFNEHVGALPDVAAWTVTAAITGLAVLLFITSADMRQTEALVRARAHELLGAKAAAEAASEAKSRFMAVMGHELRTPLTAVIGYANLLDEGLANEQNPEAKGYADRIRASGWHLLGLIDAVLLYAGGSAPAVELRQRVDVAGLVTTTVGMFKEEADRKGVTLHVNAEAAWVISDLRKLRQIIINLLSNAVKFTDRGGVDVNVYPRGENVMISIADTGIGISAAHMEHIWEAFQQVDATHTRARGGMGLGLALTRQLAQQISAELTARSTPGGGTTFTITLPRSEQLAPQAIGLNGARVLVVDDEAGVRRIMARTLTRYGGQVTQAESAQEALERINEQGSFDALVTDISMPGMTGIQLAQRLKAQRFTAPVLFVTGAELDDEDHSEIAQLAGQLLRKPFDMVELARAVQLMTAGGEN